MILDHEHEIVLSTETQHQQTNDNQFNHALQVNEYLTKLERPKQA